METSHPVTRRDLFVLGYALVFAMALLVDNQLIAAIMIAAPLVAFVVAQAL